MGIHSIRVNRRNCVGCTSCIKTCPTEAIRVQQGKAKIISERCIDCGRCILYCPHHAMVVLTTPFTELEKYPYKIALPSAALYAQFHSPVTPEDVYAALHAMGFDAIFEDARAVEILAAAMRAHLASNDAVYPVISTNCPVIPRLVTSLFPGLIDHLSPFLPAGEIAARVARSEFCERFHVPESEVGVFLISPCASEMSYIRNPIGMEKSAVSGVFAVRDIYAKLLPLVGKTANGSRTIAYPAGSQGLGFPVVGGMSAAVGSTESLAVDGIYSILQCLDEIDDGRLVHLQLLEPLACNGGCVGGPLNFENKFVSKNRIKRIEKLRPRADFDNDPLIQKYIGSPMIQYDQTFVHHDIMKLSDNVAESAHMMEKMEQVLKILPGLDCGSCGSPTCRTLAEDIVKGNAIEMDCIFRLRDKVRLMAQEMVDLANAHKRG